MRIHGRWVFGARLAAPRTAPIQRWWQRRQASSYLAAEWRRDIALTTVRLLRKPAPTRVRVESAFEVDFVTPRRPLSQLQMQLQMAAITLSAVVSALLLHRDRSLPPHDTYAPGGPTDGGIIPSRWLGASLSRPSPHPFRTSTAATAASTTVPAFSGSRGHSNSYTPHTNVVTHTNAITAHTNTDLRPLPGPL